MIELSKPPGLHLVAVDIGRWRESSLNDCYGPNEEAQLRHVINAVDASHCNSKIHALGARPTELDCDDLYEKAPLREGLTRHASIRESSVIAPQFAAGPPDPAGALPPAPAERKAHAETVVAQGRRRYGLIRLATDYSGLETPSMALAELE